MDYGEMHNFLNYCKMQLTKQVVFKICVSSQYKHLAYLSRNESNIHFFFAVFLNEAFVSNDSVKRSNCRLP